MEQLKCNIEFLIESSKILFSIINSYAIKYLSWTNSNFTKLFRLVEKKIRQKEPAFDIINLETWRSKQKAENISDFNFQMIKLS